MFPTHGDGAVPLDGAGLRETARSPHARMNRCGHRIELDNDVTSPRAGEATAQDIHTEEASAVQSCLSLRCCPPAG